MTQFSEISSIPEVTLSGLLSPMEPVNDGKKKMPIILILLIQNLKNLDVI